ncbi:nuclear pore complex assembly-domain-containing protein [Amylocystis lapponica]|nr:nuclear pore complex assembly-domain-containing protein [Amylocystis lapponica]
MTRRYSKDDDVYEEAPVSGDLFDLSPTNFAWRPPVPQEIEKRRALMSDVLIFDILLSSGGIHQPDSLYPPTDADSLQCLFDAIVNSTFDALKQDSLIYYLLKWYQDGREERLRLIVVSRHSSLHSLTRTGTWTQGSACRRVLLSDARLNREYTSKILQALALSDDSHALIRKYVRTAKPLLTEPPDIDAYVIALADASIMEAWQYQATFAESTQTRARLVHHILDWCLIPKPRAPALKQMLAFPFSPYEQALVHAYASTPATAPTGYAAALKLDRQFPAVHRSSDAQRAAQERKVLLEEFMAVMPRAERELLDLELEQGTPQPARSPQPAAANQRPPAARLTMPPLPAIAQRSGAPRFGGPVPAPSDALPLVPTAHSRPAPPPFRPNGAHTQAGASRPVSLFDVAGSANQAPNAFYKPPPSLVLKRPFGQDTARPPARPAPPAEHEHDDVPMHTDDEGALSDADADADAEGAPPDTDTLALARPGLSAEFAVSVFAPAHGPAPKARAVSAQKQKMPPGAFVPDSDSGSGGESERAPSPPRRAPAPAPARALAQSIPGGLPDEEDREEDVVAPLPRRPVRKSRAGRGGDANAKEPAHPRRSSRLSAVSSVGSPSPEASPQKPAAKTRRAPRAPATGAASATRSSARKKR